MNTHFLTILGVAALPLAAAFADSTPEPRLPPDRRVRLHFDAINYRAIAVIDLHSRLLWEGSLKTNAPPDGFRDCFTVPEPKAATPVCFVKLVTVHG